MKIMIISDTHGKNDNFLMALEREAPIDMLIHCGDIDGSEYIYSKIVDVPVYMVAGNNDFFSQLPMEREFEIEGYKVLLTHGHQYRVSMGYEFLEREAAERGVDIVMFGHIHRPVLEDDGDVIVVNPGSLSYPRQEGRLPTYMIMTVDENGELDFRHKCVVE